MCLHLWENVLLRCHALRRHAPDDSQKMKRSSTRSSWFSCTHPASSMSTPTSTSRAADLARNIVLHGPLLYTLPEITAATLNFAASQAQIGSSAWKVTLRGSCAVIVRKPGVAKSFHKLLTNVCALHHGNLARVMGGCPAADCVFVGHEFVDGSDLQACLHNTRVPGYTALSTWKMRIQVALDVAKGLEYIHQHTTPQFAHKYLTSSSVLLTKETLRAKLVLVGMAALTREVVGIEDEEALSPSMREKDDNASVEEPTEGYAWNRKRALGSSGSVKIKGRQGYMPPEYISSGAVSQKYDVFTYGVVLLELLKGRGVDAQARRAQKRALNDVSIMDEVRALMENTEGRRGKLRLWIDSRLEDSYPVEDAAKVVVLALSCASEDPQKRPAMNMVALQMAIILNSAEEWEKQRTIVTQSETLQGR